jgi:acyl dehydratase
VHSDQRFVHSRPVHAGDELRVILSIEAIKTVAGNELISNKTEVRTTAGELVTTAYASIVVRGE